MVSSWLVEEKNFDEFLKNMKSQNNVFGLEKLRNRYKDYSTDILKFTQEKDFWTFCNGSRKSEQQTYFCHGCSYYESGCKIIKFTTREEKLKRIING